MKMKKFRNLAQKGKIQRIESDYRYTAKLFDRQSKTVQTCNVESKDSAQAKANIKIAFPDAVILSLEKGEKVRSTGYLVDIQKFYEIADSYVLEDI